MRPPAGPPRGLEVVERLADAGAVVEYHAGFLAAPEADHLLGTLLEEVSFPPADQRQVRIHGRWIAIPRQQVAFGDPGTAYRFSGTRVLARPFTPTLLALRGRVAGYVRTGRPPPNFVLVNLYRDGRDYVGLHADDERDLEPEPDIFSASLGAERDFVLVPRASAPVGRSSAKADTLRRRPRQGPPSGAASGGGAPRFVLRLGHGSLLVMRHPTNRRFKHGLPRRANVARPRASLTFRRMDARSGPKTA